MSSEDGQDFGSLGLVPYDQSNLQIILRHNNAVVVYDPASHQLALRSSTNPTGLGEPVCPTCQRPILVHEEDVGEDTVDPSSPGIPGGFRSPEYFQSVQRSLEAAADAAPPSSPRRRLVQPRRTPSNQQTPTESPLNVPVDGSPVSSGPGQRISSSSYSQHFLQKVFVVKKELGKGGKGVVYLVEHVLDGVPLGLHACKRVPVGNNHEWLEKVLTEVQTLSRLHHQNLVAYQHVWLEETQLANFGPPVTCAYILQEYCNMGDLQTYVVGTAKVNNTPEELKNRLRRRSKGELDPPNELRGLHFDEIYSFFRDITAGIQFLHANNYIHRDLKPSNCLLHRSKQGLRVLVSDFGEAQEQNMVRKSTGATGTVSYCAPEVLQRIGPSGPLGNFTPASDIFSLGMILYFICFASLPYRNANVLDEESEDLDRLRAEVSQWTGFDEERRLRPDLPEELYHFLKRLLAPRKEDRPTADEISNALRTRHGLGESKQPRPPRTPPLPFEELTPRRRIIPLDSPGPSSPRNSPEPTTTGRSTAVTRLRPTRLRHSISEDSTSRRSSSENIHGQSTSPHRDLILRRPMPSPQRQNQEERDEEGDDSVIHQTYLLTDNFLTSNTWRDRLVISLRSPQSRRTISFIIVGVKVLSILQPCAYRGMNRMVTYPLVLLALWDFSLGGWHYGVSMIALMVHLVVLGVALRSNTLCHGREWPVESLG